MFRCSTLATRRASVVIYNLKTDRRDVSCLVLGYCGEALPLETENCDAMAQKEIRYFSMNTSLKNAKIFEDDSSNSLDPIKIKEEPSDDTWGSRDYSYTPVKQKPVADVQIKQDVRFGAAYFGDDAVSSPIKQERLDFESKLTLKTDESESSSQSVQHKGEPAHQQDEKKPYSNGGNVRKKAGNLKSSYDVGLRDYMNLRRKNVQSPVKEDLVRKRNESPDSPDRKRIKENPKNRYLHCIGLARE